MNICHFYGYTSPDLMMVSELASEGSLLTYLRGQRDSTDALAATQIGTFAVQIAAGMTFMSRNQMVHRDLAARNVLLVEGLVCKVTDFGLARSVYEDVDGQYRANAGDRPSNPTAWKWTSLEGIRDSVYTVEGDVWSFGVVLAEICSLGNTPYPQHAAFTNTFTSFLKKGDRMLMDESWPDFVYTVMLRCWSAAPTARPTFDCLVRVFSSWCRTGCRPNGVPEFDVAEAPAQEAAARTGGEGGGAGGETDAPAGAPHTSHGCVSDQRLRAWEIDDPKLLTLTKRIGGGAFGDVHAGTLRQKAAAAGVRPHRVAVKVAKPVAEGDSDGALLEEAALMAQFNHPNIVALIGVVSRTSPCKIALQYCEQGSLQSLLRAGAIGAAHGADGSDGTGHGVEEAAALAIMCDVSAGMAYLENKQHVHRDLASRNILCLLDGTCLVADFGMSRALNQEKLYYRVREGVQIPLRWSAPEVVKGFVHSTASDVWSFFVLTWEVFTCAARPFGEMMDMMVAISLERVAEGKADPIALLPRPTAMPEELHTTLASMCLAVDPAHRTDFATLNGWAAGEATRAGPAKMSLASGAGGSSGAYQMPLTVGAQAYSAQRHGDGTALGAQPYSLPGGKAYRGPVSGEAGAADTDANATERHQGEGAVSEPDITAATARPYQRQSSGDVRLYEQGAAASNAPPSSPNSNQPVRNLGTGEGPADSTA